jgi:hypothetical protein
MEDRHLVVDIRLHVLNQTFSGTVRVRRAGEPKASSYRAIAGGARDGMDEAWEVLDAAVSTYLATFDQERLW